MAYRPKILVVDDRLSNIELLSKIFVDTYEVLSAMNGVDALHLAATQNPELILLDVLMPEMDGYEVCRRLKSVQLTKGIPVIFITGLGDEGGEILGLELGAEDYITKPFRPSVIRMRVKHQIELKQAREQLTLLSVTDGLTGLANRRHFDEVLAKEYSRHARSGAELSLILMDIDYFKAYNDTYGHVSGDECLRQVAHKITSIILRSNDLAARYGGEEFACILPETDLAAAMCVAEKIRQGIRELKIPHRSSTVTDCVTISIGVVTAHCIPGKSESNIITLADEQLYAAKSGGRNRVACKP